MEISLINWFRHCDLFISVSRKKQWFYLALKIYTYICFPFWSVSKVRKILCACLYFGGKRLFYSHGYSLSSSLWLRVLNTRPSYHLEFLQCRHCSLEIGWYHQTNFQAIRMNLSGLITCLFIWIYLLFQCLPRSEWLHQSSQYHNPL